LEASGAHLPGVFRSSIQQVREGSGSLRVTIPDGVAKLLEAVPDGELVWTVDLSKGRVEVTAEPPGKSGKSSKDR
jgi:hypothetical protein